MRSNKKAGSGLVSLPFQAYASSPTCANASVIVNPDEVHHALMECPPSLVVPALPPPPDQALSRMLVPRKLQPHAVPSAAKTVFLHCWAFLACLRVAPSFGPSGEAHLQQGTRWLELFCAFHAQGGTLVEPGGSISSPRVVVVVVVVVGGRRGALLAEAPRDASYTQRREIYCVKFRCRRFQ